MKEEYGTMSPVRTGVVTESRSGQDIRALQNTGEGQNSGKDEDAGSDEDSG